MKIQCLDFLRSILLCLKILLTLHKTIILTTIVTKLKFYKDEEGVHANLGSWGMKINWFSGLVQSDGKQKPLLAFKMRIEV